MPPPVGWRPAKAFDILCPSEAALFKEGGEALESAINQDLHRLSFRVVRYPEVLPDAWRTLQLLDAVRRRPDLQLTGRHPYTTLGHRVAVEPDVLEAACERDNRDQAVRRRWVYIDFCNDRLSSNFDVPQTFMNVQQSQHLDDVRVVAVHVQGAAVALQTDPVASAAGAGEATTLEFSETRLRAWFRLRVDGWPKDRALPTRAECLEAACTYFGCKISRDRLYRIRRGIVPEPWNKRGPRRPPN
jgi:hypothetical protein